MFNIHSMVISKEMETMLKFMYVVTSFVANCKWVLTEKWDLGKQKKKCSFIKGFEPDTKIWHPKLGCLNHSKR